MFSPTLTSLVAIFLVLAFSLPALAQITVNIPSTIRQCEQTTFSWSGGTAPYYIFFNTTANVRSDSIEDRGNVTIITGLGFGNIYDTSYSTPLNFQTFQPGSFQVTDSKNITSDLKPFSLQPGSTAGCLVQFTNGIDMANGFVDSVGLQQPFGDVHSCDGTTIEWLGGVTPYTLVIRTTGLSILQEQVFAGFDSTSPTVTINFPPGVSVNFAVEDNAGQTDEIGPILLNKPFVDCLINNMTTLNSSIPSPTTTLPFPTFFSHVPKPTIPRSGGPDNDPDDPGGSHSGGGDGGDDGGLSTGAIIGIIIGIPAGISLILGLASLLSAGRARNRRQTMLEPYFMAGHGNSSSAGGNLNGSPVHNASPNVNMQEGVYSAQPAPAQEVDNETRSSKTTSATYSRTVGNSDINGVLPKDQV